MPSEEPDECGYYHHGLTASVMVRPAVSKVGGETTQTNIVDLIARQQTSKAE